MLYEKPKDLGDKLKEWPEPSLPERGMKILEDRYLLKDNTGKIIETPKELMYRVASTVASADVAYGDKDVSKTEQRFYEMMAKGDFFPNSPTLKGAGLGINLSACYVLPVEDSREGIFDTLKDAVNIQAFGGGTGFNFSELRPKGSRIGTTGGVSSGPLSFMEIYDLTIGNVIAQGGTRQGANMAILNYDHPDVVNFINSKIQEGKLRNFNLSVGVDESFIEKAKKGEDYILRHSKGNKEITQNAEKFFENIVQNAWASGDPGMIFLDRLERDNPTPHIGKIVSTNPCGEQPLLPYESCNLGSINVKNFVQNGKLNYEALGETVKDAVHFLDNVIDVNKYTLEKIDKTVKGNRKIGLGIMGWADTLAQMKVAYGSEESLSLASKVMTFINETAKEASVKLAEKKGVFPNWEGSIYDKNSPHYKGEDLKLRNATRTTIAPTGTLSNLADVEGGIEPFFKIAYQRKSVFDEKGEAKHKFRVMNSALNYIAKQEGFYSEKLADEIFEAGGSLGKMKKPKEIGEERWKEIQRIFVSSDELTPEQHLKMQAAFQEGVDNAISKTINFPNSATVEDIKKAYLLSADLGIKGITVYRDGCKSVQVLSSGGGIQKENNLEKKVNSKDRPPVIGTTIKQKTPHGNAFITLNVLKEDYSRPYETFIEVGKGGKDMSAIAEGYGRLVSLALKKGVEIKDIVDQLSGIGGGTQTGFGPNRVTSLPDALSRGLQQGYEELNGEIEQNKEPKISGDLCPDCHGQLVHIQGCTKCSDGDCGYSKC